jgi:hypothetical protein
MSILVSVCHLWLFNPVHFGAIKIVLIPRRTQKDEPLLETLSFEEIEGVLERGQERRLSYYLPDRLCDVGPATPAVELERDELA